MFLLFATSMAESIMSVPVSAEIGEETPRNTRINGIISPIATKMTSIAVFDDFIHFM